MAAITRPDDFFDRTGTYARRIGTYTGPVSYATGGDTLNPEEVALGRITHADLKVAFNVVSGAVRLLAYDPVAKKVLWYVPNTGSEVAAATDLSGYSTRFEMLGK